MRARLSTAGPLKLAVARGLSSPPMGYAVGTLTRHHVPSHDLVFDTSDPVVTRKVEAQLFWRLYESAEIRFAREHLAGVSTLIDLGSSLGFAASHALTRMAPDGRIVAVEANADLLSQLRRTLETHADGRLVTVLHAAVDYRHDAVSFTRSAESVGGRVATDSETGPKVPTVTLADILDTEGIDRYALMADIEGAEADIIDRDAASLGRCDRMVIELHDTPRRTVEAMRGQLELLGFRVAASRGPVMALTR